MRTRTGGLSGAAAVLAVAAPWSGRGASERPAAWGAAAGAAARSAVGAVLGAQAPSSVTASTARQRSRIAFMVSPSPTGGPNGHDYSRSPTVPLARAPARP